MAILGQWLCVQHRQGTGLADHSRGQGLTTQPLFDVGQTPRHRRHAAQHHVGSPYARAIHLQHHRYADFGMGPGCPVGDFQIGADDARRGRREADAGEELRGREDVFPRRVLAGQDEKLGSGQAPFPFRTGDLERRIEGDQRRSQIRGMDA